MTDLKKHPLAITAALLLLTMAAYHACAMAGNGVWDAAVVDMLMAIWLTGRFLQKVFSTQEQRPGIKAKITAWVLILLSVLLIFIPADEFLHGIGSSLALALLICGVLLHFGGAKIALWSIAPIIWCSVYMPCREEFMLMASYPLRLSSAELSAIILNISGIEVVTAGSSIRLPGLDIAVTDACSGINQLDAFFLLGAVITRRKAEMKWLHFLFIIPSIIAGNTIRIVLTIWLYRMLGEAVLESSWHIALGYVQVLLTMLIFLAAGKVFKTALPKGGGSLWPGIRKANPAVVLSVATCKVTAETALPEVLSEPRRMACRVLAVPSILEGKMKKILIVSSLLIFTPYAKYLWQTWRSSPMDSLDWIFFLLAVPAAVFALRRHRMERHCHWAWLSAVPAFLLTAGRDIHHVNAAGSLGCIWFVWSVTWLLAGWSTAGILLPVSLITALGTPGSTYWLSMLTGLDVQQVWAVKFLLTAGCFVWIYFNIIPKKETVFFAATVLAALLLLHTGELFFIRQSFIPQFNLQAGKFTGRAIIPDENTRRFFASSTVTQYRYNHGDRDIAVLAVRCGSDIHEIHPASHCLRSGKWQILSEKIYHVNSDFAVTEITAQRGADRILVWVWYSGKDFSTPAFPGFRRYFRPGSECYTYQISTPAYSNARQILHEFISIVGGKDTDAPF